MKLKTGDRVRLLDFEGEGTVVSVSGRGTVIVDIDGMQIPANESELAKTGSDDYEKECVMYENTCSAGNFTAKAKGDAVRPYLNPFSGGRTCEKRNSRSKDTMVVDLHFDNVCRHFPAARNVPESECLGVQLEFFGRKLDAAIRGDYRRVVFIHGKGRHVLKREIENILRTQYGFRYREASVFEYDGGAIEVEL